MNSTTRGKFLVQWAKTVPWMIHPPYLASMAEIAVGATLELEDGTKVEALVADTEQQYKSLESSLVGPNNEVAVIKIVGPIFRYADFFTMLCGGATTESIAKDLRAARDDPAVKAIILQVDSPGGEVPGISELGDMIRQANSVKPTWAYGDGYVCSAAYWLAASAAKLIVSNTAMVGSVGTVCSVRNPDTEDNSVIEIVSSQSPLKRPDIRTEEGRAEIQGTADSLTAVFFQHLSEVRNVSEAYIAENFGRGGILIGASAVGVKMADEVGTFDSTLEAILVAASDTGVKKEGRHMSLDRKTQANQDTPQPQSRWDRLLAWASERTAEDREIETMLEEGTLPDPAAIGLVAASAPPRNVPTPVVEAVKVGGVEIPEPTIPPVAAAAIQVDPRVAELEAQIAQMNAEREQERLQSLQREAALFAAALTRDGRVEPFEQSGIIDMYLQLSEDDRERPLSAGSRLETFRSMQTSRTAIDRVSERVPVVPVAGPDTSTQENGERRLVLLQNNTETPRPDDGAGPMDEETRRANLMKTATGRRALAQEDARREAAARAQ